MSLLITIFQIIFGISLIVMIHEMGHMLFAKLFGMRVESFTIGFPPKIIKKKIGETEYGIGSIPLGGYVKISGMIDESLDTKSLTGNKPQEYEFRAKPRWQRMIVILGGVFANFVLGIIIYICLIFSSGKSYISKDEVNKYGIVTNEIGRNIGFKDGDKILSINGKNFHNFNKIFSPKSFLITGQNTAIEVENNDIKRNIILSQENYYKNVISRDEKNTTKYIQCISPRVPFRIIKVNNKELPIVAGDKILSINGEKIDFVNELHDTLLKYKGQIVTLKYLHKGTEFTDKINLSTNGKLGIELESLLKINKKKYSFWKSIIIGTKQSYDVSKMNIVGLYKIITGKLSAKENLSGPIGIIKVFSQSNNWQYFWNIVAMISLCLGIMNVLPIPSLDGGHAVLILIEMITRRKIKEKYLIKIQTIGMALILLLAMYCIYNDIIHLI